MKLLATALVLTTTLGCFTPSQRREDTLVQLARQTNDDLRWERWDTAMNAMGRDDARAFRQRLNDMGDELTMADYEVTNITFKSGGEAAIVTATFNWYSKRNLVMKKTVVDELWDYKGGGWRLTSMRRVRGDRFGLIPEPVVLPDGGAPDTGSG